METMPCSSNHNLIEIPKLADYSLGMPGNSLPLLGDAHFQMGHYQYSLRMELRGQNLKEVICLQQLNWLALLTALLFWNKLMKPDWRNIQGNCYSSRGGCQSGVLGFLPHLASQKAKPEGRLGAGCVAAGRDGVAGPWFSRNAHASVGNHRAWCGASAGQGAVKTMSLR